MNKTLKIVYGTKHEGVDLTTLASSFIGTNELLKEYFSYSGINGELSIKTEKISNGSIIIELGFGILLNFPFDNVKDLLDFLQVSDAEMFHQAKIFFNELGNTRRNVNDYAREYPLDAAVIVSLLIKYFPKMIKYASLQKRKLTLEDEKGISIPKKFAYKLKKSITDRRYRKLLRPIQEEEVSYIEFSNEETNALIDNTNFESYLTEDEKILPNFVNGSTVSLSGKIKALVSTRGDTLKIKASDVDPKNDLLVVYPEEGKDTGEYREYYLKDVNIVAEVFRKSEYKRPELILKKIELKQPDLL